MTKAGERLIAAAQEARSAVERDNWEVDVTPEGVAIMRERAGPRMERGRWVQIDPPAKEGENA